MEDLQRRYEDGLAHSMPDFVITQCSFQPTCGMDEALRIGQYGAAKLNCSRATDAERLECLQVSDVSSLHLNNESRV